MKLTAVGVRSTLLKVFAAVLMLMCCMDGLCFTALLVAVVFRNVLLLSVQVFVVAQALFEMSGDLQRSF